MADRLEDATVEVRVRYTAHGVNREYVANMTGEKVLPIVFEVARDNPSAGIPNPGGRILIETRSPITSTQRAVRPLPKAVFATIEERLAAERRRLEEAAWIVLDAVEGATGVSIDGDGRVHPTT